MKKQICYPDLIPRIFSSSIDWAIMYTLLGSISDFFVKIVFVQIFKEYIIRNAIKITDVESVIKVMYSAKFIEENASSPNLFYFMGVQMLFGMAICGLFLIYFWHNFGLTPGKYILGMRIRREDNMDAFPTIWQCVKRFISYPTSLIGIFFILFTEKKQAWHDKIAGTVIIKK